MNGEQARRAEDFNTLAPLHFRNRFWRLREDEVPATAHRPHFRIRPTRAEAIPNFPERRALRIINIDRAPTHRRQRHARKCVGPYAPPRRYLIFVDGCAVPLRQRLLSPVAFLLPDPEGMVGIPEKASVGSAASTSRISS
jgi:hypothetical protein